MNKNIEIKEEEERSTSYDE